MADHILSAPTTGSAALDVRRITRHDVIEALGSGISDFLAASTHALFLVVLYPVIGLVIGFVSADAELMPLFFPLAAGFALLGPVAALGLYELSRRREQDEPAGISAASAVLRSPALSGVLELAALLAVLFVAWLVTAMLILRGTVGVPDTSSPGAFLAHVLGTPAGWALIIIGNAVGALFAMAAFALSAVSFPLMLDRKVGVGTAIATSVRAIQVNPGPMLFWAAIIAAGMVAGTLTLFVGLAVVLPVLGHATWHMYRRLVP